MSTVKSCVLIIGIVLLSTGVGPGLLERARAGEPSSPASATEENHIATKKRQALARARQVLLDVHVATMKPRDLRKLGEWRDMTFRDDASLSTGPQDGGGARGNSEMIAKVLCAPDGASTNSLWAVMNDLEKKRRLRIVANPQIVEPDGREALLIALDGEWFLMTARPTDHFIDSAGLSKLDPESAILITPHVDANNVLLKTTVEIPGRVGARRNTPRGVVVRRTEQHCAAIQSGGTVAWVGLTQYGRERNRPSGLAGLPLIGGLFRNAKTNRPSGETVIFITTNLIPEPEPKTPPGSRIN